jgi:Tfp pilus assembly protein PilN
MQEFNLIPADYREREQIQRKCTVFAISLFGLILILAGLHIVVHKVTSSLKSEIEILENGKTLKQQQQQKFTDLLTQERSLTKRLEIFNAIRGGPPIRQLFTALDRILDGSVWFTQMKFQRSGEIVENKPETSHNGYFITIPDETSSTGNAKTWQLQTRLEIAGQAIDHSKLSQFVNKLIAQPEIEDVKVLNTNLKTYVSTQAVEFNMIIIIDNNYLADHV